MYESLILSATLKNQIVSSNKITHNIVLLSSTDFYGFRSLHVGGGLFQFPLLQVRIGYPITVVPGRQTKNAVLSFKITLPFMGS